MADNTPIEWTTNTWNPWQGCHKVSPGCDNCYMHQAKKRYGQDPTKVVRSKDATFYRPLRKGGKRWKSGSMIFICSWSDFFHPDADEWRSEAWEIIRQRQDLIFQILTKRTHLIADRFPSDWGDGWPNVWLGATVENQKYADRRIPELLPIPAAVRFVSIEPMLEEIDIEGYLGRDLVIAEDETGAFLDGNGLDWVIVGGETGPGARPMRPEWARDIHDQCKAAGMPFFMKNMSGGGKPPTDLLIREFPEAK